MKSFLSGVKRGLHLEDFFSSTGCRTKRKLPSLAYYLVIVEIWEEKNFVFFLGINVK